MKGATSQQLLMGSN